MKTGRLHNMKTPKIQVVITGTTGSGKSCIAFLLKNVLKAFGIHDLRETKEN